MQRLYCPKCGEYLEGGDGSMRDCICGWQQPQQATAETSHGEIEEACEELKWALTLLASASDKDDAYDKVQNELRNIRALADQMVPDDDA